MRFHREMWIWIALLAVVNAGLLLGRPMHGLAFSSAGAEAGEWWRFVTYPLVHVSGYHLLLDAAGFLILYAMLNESTVVRRVAAGLAASAGSLGLVVLVGAPDLASLGLCGLSGPAHGLMTIVSLQQIGSANRTEAAAGWVCMGLVGVKSLVEAMTGSVFLSLYHIGDVGTPVAACHFGGMLGGTAWWLWMSVSGGEENKQSGLQLEPTASGRRIRS